MTVKAEGDRLFTGDEQTTKLKRLHAEIEHSVAQFAACQANQEEYGENKDYDLSDVVARLCDDVDDLGQALGVS